ncbi:CYFA0S09e04698g1_1 [Cyberlindnera fabianii]|uniref:CYFA0S09e04698g1_1 n=1 Tax=Cyberlindnera fabianii TaxID=36022 RepID=A0A061B6J4_CYBFA|nr:CYFA0S09e04698g1_1 [Cyberlindnera fabianii]
MGFFTRKEHSEKDSEHHTEGIPLENATTKSSGSHYDPDFAKLQSKMQVREGNWILKLLTGKKPRPIVKNDEIYPYLTANWFSVLTFQWTSDFINRGYLRRIETEDLYQLGGDLKVDEMTKRLLANIEKRSDKWEQTHPGKPWGLWLLFLALSDTYKQRFWYVGATNKVIADVSQVCTPLLVRALVKYIQRKPTHDPGVGHAIGYAIGIAVMQMVSALAIAAFFHTSMVTGAQVKATLMNIIYVKSFKLSTKARFEFPTSKISSMVMTDLNRIDIAVGTFHFLWAFPISFGVGLVVLIVSIGWPAVIGILVVLAYIATTYFFNKKLKDLRKASVPYADKRTRAINEIVDSLKMIKFYCWEKPYYTIVESHRVKEKKFVFWIQILRAFQNSGTSSITYFAAMVTFLVMIYAPSTGGHFSSYNIFSSITLFNMLRMPLNLIPIATAQAIDASIALESVAKFLQVEEGEDTLERHAIDDSEDAIHIENATFVWDLEEDEFSKSAKAEAVNVKSNTTVKLRPVTSDTIDGISAGDDDEEEEEDLSFPGLKNISLDIHRGELVIVTGSIGTGKTSLLNAIEGSMRKDSGRSSIYGSLTFCSYPWIQNATIRSNITFGRPYNSRKYNEVVRACSLDVDLSVLPNGDMTEVGERGITLSGGQKARINLARAVYADRDIILLDDVLSAVDARVGKHIMEQCICGLLAGKTRVLATHQLSLIDAADRVIILDGSGSLDIGTEAELLKRSKEFKSLMEFSKDIEEDEETNGEPLEDAIALDEKALEKQLTHLTKTETSGANNNEGDFDSNKQSEEQRKTGSIGLMVYWQYMAVGSGRWAFLIIPLFLITFVVNGFLQVFYSVWLSFWLSNKFDLTQGAYTGIFCMLVIVAFLSYIVLYCMMAGINNNAGLELFNMACSKLLKTPMSFMDVTPVGRILNRFTKDVDTLDNEMIEQLRLLLTSVNLVCATLILCIIYIPWFALAIPFAGVLYYLIFTYYKPSALDIKRIESTNRSFVFSLFTETLSGMKVIKSYDSQERFQERYKVLIDNMNSAYYLTFANQRWLSIRLDIVSAALTLFISVMCACSVFDVTASSAGLLVSYMVQTCALMSLLLRALTQVENNFNSVERLLEYAYDLPEEGPFENEASKPEASWPQHGSIRFEDVSLAYRPGLPLVLKNATFDVNGAEKIGVCGRTGAGKSTIMNALFRVSPLVSGRICIDDVDIGQLGLDDLRSKLSIIPQDPVLFHGTIRQNLDPFGNATDQQLWDALRRSWLVEEGASGLGSYTQGDNIKFLHKFHLDQLVEDNGANFSLGERQLLALARALVRDSKILIMDEATSSVDYETDAKIQSTIANEFRQCTILCIAHRLKTILSYDRILVLDKGEVKEFDTPINLFKMGGIFSEMCERSDITETDF